MYDLAMDELYDLKKELKALRDRNSFLEQMLATVACKRCGGVSWDVPLLDYCSCGPKPASDRQSPYSTPTSPVEPGQTS